MPFELGIMPGCPNSTPALKLFRDALRAEGMNPYNVKVFEISSDTEAAAGNFHGSPSFMYKGQDLFPSTAGTGLSCRVYPAGKGFAGMPSLESLRAAVRGVGAHA